MNKEYEVMLEGKDGDHGFFITFEVSCKSKERAIQLTLQKAEDIGLEIVRVEEVEDIREVFLDVEKVQQSSGKSYFRLEK